jgi:hypothetical protein
MKQVRGPVELHGDVIELHEGNHQKYVTIKNVSSYDFQGIIMNQTDDWKLDLLNELCKELGVDRLSKNIDGTFKHHKNIK